MDLPAPRAEDSTAAESASSFGTAPPSAAATLSKPLARLWLRTALVLLAGVAGFAFLFTEEIRKATEVWAESTAYNHCYLILPISLYLMWERRDIVLRRAPAPTPWPLLAIPAIGLMWLFASAMGIMEGRQLAAMTLVQVFLFAALGPSAWRVIGFALLYLYFLVPSGAFVTPVLQDFAARFAIRGLEILHVPVYSDGYEIQVPGADFVVAEACAGLRFLIASIALGALYGYTMYRTAGRRIVFLAVSTITPVIANGFRVLGIVLLGYWLGNAKAATADHLIYGWVFFSAVSLLLIVMGLPFRQTGTVFATPVEPPAATLQRRALPLLAVAATSLALTALLVSPLVSGGPPAAAMGSAVAGLRHMLGR